MKIVTNPPTRIVSSVEAYRLVIKEDLRALIREAIALEHSHLNSEEYSDRRERLETKLYDLYQEIGWHVVYDFKEVPF